MNIRNFSHLIQTKKVLYLCENGSLTGLFNLLKLYFTQNFQNRKLRFYKHQLLLQFHTCYKNTAPNQFTFLFVASIIFAHFFTKKKGKDYSGTKFFYTEPLFLNKAHSTKWKAFNNKTLYLYNHSQKKKHGQSLDISLSDREVSNESKVENTYNVTGCDRNHSLRSVTFIAALKIVIQQFWVWSARQHSIK